MASRSIDLISKKKKKLHVQHTFCLCLCFAQLHTSLFCRTKTSNLFVTHYFYGGIVVCAYQYFVSCVHVRFYFSLPLIFTLLASSISLCLTAALNFMYFFLQNLSLFNHSLQLFLRYPRECKHKKKHRKRQDFVVVFLCKSPGGHAISFQIKP